MCRTIFVEWRKKCIYNFIFGCRQIIVREGGKKDFKRLLGKFREIVRWRPLEGRYPMINPGSKPDQRHLKPDKNYCIYSVEIFCKNLDKNKNSIRKVIKECENGIIDQHSQAPHIQVHMRAVHKQSTICVHPWAVHTSLPPATKLGQGNVFTGVCDSINRGMSARGVPAPGGVSALGGVPAPEGGVCSQGGCLVWGVWFWGGSGPGREVYPPFFSIFFSIFFSKLFFNFWSIILSFVHLFHTTITTTTTIKAPLPPNDGQWAGGTHPTGMHSCLTCNVQPPGCT